jgi:hypothetical protein
MHLHTLDHLVLVLPLHFSLKSTFTRIPARPNPHLRRMFSVFPGLFRRSPELSCAGPGITYPAIRYLKTIPEPESTDGLVSEAKDGTSDADWQPST